jgi:hypothetical protein
LRKGELILLIRTGRMAELRYLIQNLRIAPSR